MTKWHGGKGSKQRPVKDRKQFSDNWDKIFGKPKQDTQTESEKKQDKDK